MTEMATITPTRIFTPEGNAPGALLDENNQKWKFWTKGFNGKPGGIPVETFQVGVAATVGYAVKRDKNGNNEHFITSVAGATTRPAQQVLPKPVATPPRAQTNPKDSEQIFCMALVKEMISAGRQYSVTDLIGMVNDCRDVYRNTFGSPAKQQVEAEFNDEIKF